MTNLRDLDERLTRLEEDSYEAVRLADQGVFPQAAIWQTVNDPGGNYPQAIEGLGNCVYYGVPAQIQGDLYEDGPVGATGFDEPTGPENTGDYFINLGFSYIPPATFVPVWNDGGTNFTCYTFPAFYVASTAQDITPSMGATIYPNPPITIQLQGQTVTMPVPNPYNCCIPKGYQWIQVAQTAAGGLVITGPQFVMCAGVLNADITTPGGSAQASPKLWNSLSQYGGFPLLNNTQVTVVDYNQLGGQANESITMAFLGQWILLSAPTCIPA